jgi:hypothetical protein
VDVRGQAERENLTSFLVDLPVGRHALAVLGSLPMAGAMDSFEAVAKDQRARFVRVGPKLSLPSLDVRSLDDGGGGSDPLIAVDAPASMAREGTGRHLGAERVVAAMNLNRTRIVCVYSRESVFGLTRREMLTVANAHDDMLLPEDLE